MVKLPILESLYVQNMINDDFYGSKEINELQTEYFDFMVE